jgi:hypothetical protein
MPNVLAISPLIDFATTCFFGLIGCVVAFLIAIRQSKQLDQVTTIGKDTQQTAAKLNADSYRQETVQKFFFPGKKAHKYKCLLPVVWAGKPLPNICAGDYHALHVLQILLGRERLDLSFQDPAGKEKNQGSNCDAIFLCSPQANPALQQLAPPIQIGPSALIPKFDGVELPCWFAEGISYGPGGEEAKTMKIWECILKQPIASPAEEDHRRARPGEVPDHLNPVLRDYAIVMRLTVGDRTIFVMAGIHQYGTWIAGEFLTQLTLQNKSCISADERNALMQENDILAILWGDFNTKLLSVDDLGILANYIWIRQKTGEWKQYIAPREEKT